MRVCSLLPSATEIVFALGMGESLVGVSHECNYPAAAARLPKVTWSNLAADLASKEIDTAVSAALASGATLYDLDVALLERLAPDVILTQRLCDVCAVSYDRIQEAVAALARKPRVVNLEPHSLDGILEGIGTVAAALGRERAGELLRTGLRQRIDAVRRRTRALPRPRVFCMEWVDPPYCAGHWMRELVELAGGEDALSNPHRPSYRIEWRKVLDFAPEVIVLICCGYSLPRCMQEAALLARLEGVMDLPAVRNGRVYATDGSSFFTRPGPRVVDGLEILAHLIHPESFPAPQRPYAWKRIELPRASAESDPPASPCTKVCKIDSASGWCLGCYRTLDEIAGWLGYSAERKSELLRVLAQRRRQHAGPSSGAAGATLGASSCPRCGGEFVCGGQQQSQACWCAGFPHVMPLASAADKCLCPQCLADAIG